MNSERWKQIDKLFHAALNREPGQRAAFLEQACAGDASLRREVESMLASDEQARSFIEKPAAENVAGLLVNQATQSMVGRTMGPYKITSSLGEGGMGEVYLAEDTRLARHVAIKFLLPHSGSEEQTKRRLIREAQAAAKLDHPHICTIHEVGEENGQAYIVMQYIEGETLAARLDRQPLQLTETLEIAIQVTDALAEAHSRGIIHRDIKPQNIMISLQGQVKVLDFGLAKFVQEGSSEVTHTLVTGPGHISGTVPYMSPEQLEGKSVDARSDLFSLGIVLCEMLTGKNPFAAENSAATIAAILTGEPLSLVRFPKVPRELQRIVRKCLEKTPERRYQTAVELLEDLRALTRQHSPQTTAAAFLRFFRLPQVRVAFLLTLAFLIGGGAWLVHRTAKIRWAEKEAIPEISRLMEKQQPLAALGLLRQAEQYAPSFPELIRLKEGLFVSAIMIETTPPGAEIYVRDYADTKPGDSHWIFLGQSPLQAVQLPLGYYRVRATKEGFERLELAFATVGVTTIQLRLHTTEETPSDMVWVPGVKRNAAFPAVAPADASEFWLDKYEVTNRKFKEFVDRGGYQKREYWKQPFVKGGQTLTWEEAMTKFLDATGRTGPATWELGTYPEGEADFPVGGVSWYEAAAYAEFVGKSLPTVYHWYSPAWLGVNSDILTFSNFAGRGPAQVGAYQGLGPFGTYDMAGNVKEWCLNPAGDRRYILGGGWNEPEYVFHDLDARRPFERAATFGFRCAKYILPPPGALTGPVVNVSHDSRTDKPSDDRTFRIYRSMYSYDKTDLKPKVESVNDSSPYWRMEKVSFQAAYGNERVPAYLYLPKNAAPPYQAVVFFPGSAALSVRSIELLGADRRSAETVVRSGRALIWPAYNGTLERGPSPDYFSLGQTNLGREQDHEWSKDLGRSIDYLETRADIDIGKLAFYGLSLGAAIGPRLIAVEPRFRAGLLMSGGLLGGMPAEVDPLNFAPRVKIPILMLNGRDDFVFPLETSQLPLFRLLGTPGKDKRHQLYDGGHDIHIRLDVIKDSLEWLDRYLGPVSK